MAIERERKFIVNGQMLPAEALKNFYEVTAGYFTDGPIAIRVTSRVNGKQKICFKGPGTEEREEFEYIIPKEDAERLLALSPTRLTKKRYLYKGWEIDRFILPTKEGQPLTEGFVEFWMAEWEEEPGKGPIPSPLPPWIVVECTTDPEYSNMKMAWRYGRVK